MPIAYTDTPLHQGMRQQLIQTIVKRGITQPKVIKAMAALPRHWFLDSAMLHFAYQDKAVKILDGQTISQPFTVAFQTELLDVQPKNKILEIGTGSGYQSCVLTALGAVVYSIERQEKLHNYTKKLLKHLNLDQNLHLFLGDGSLGLAEHAPFHKIIVTAGAPVVPQTLVAQLVVNGVLVIPVGDAQSQKMLRITKLDEGNNYKTETYHDCSFVPLLGKEAWQ